MKPDRVLHWVEHDKTGRIVGRRYGEPTPLSTPHLEPVPLVDRIERTGEPLIIAPTKPTGAGLTRATPSLSPTLFERMSEAQRLPPVKPPRPRRGQ